MRTCDRFFKRRSLASIAGRVLLGSVPTSFLCLPLTVSGQTTGENANKDAFSRQPQSTGSTSPSVTAGQPELASPDSDLRNSFPPSFYGGAAQEPTSSIGLPGFAAPQAAERPLEPAGTYPLQWGPFSAHPHLTYGLTYADGVLVAPGQQTRTALNAISPGLSIYSKHLLLDYTPSIGIYSKGPYQDTLNHSVSLAANFGYKDWSFHIAQSYQRSTNPLIETALQTEIQSFVTSIDASWNLNEKVFFDFTFYQLFLEAQGFQNSRQWSSIEWANYRLTRHLSVGAGLGGGYTDVDFGSNSTFEQIQGRLNWQPSSRLMVNLNGGIEIRQFVNTPGSDNLVNPIMGASAVYRIFDGTSLTLAANRSVGSSFYANEITETTSLSAGMSQRLLKYLRLGVTAGYRSSDYVSTFSFFNHSFETVRRDNYDFISTTLGTTFLRKTSVSFAYTHSYNHSTLRGYTYNSDQFSLQLTYRF